jgi:hypothetical protein
MANQNILFRSRPFSGVRLSYNRVSFPTGTPVDTNFAEGNGQRYYYSLINGTFSNSMESATFESFVGLTMSGAQSHFFELLPLLPGELAHIETTITAVNASVSKGFIANTQAAYINTGSVIKPIGGTPSVKYDIKSDFTNVNVAFVENGTQSMMLYLIGQGGENLDWSIFIKYKKAFHSISNPSLDPLKPIYPIL